MAQHTQNKGESGDKQHTPTQPTQAPTHARAQRAEVRAWVSGRESRRARRLLLGSIRTPSTEHILQASGRGRRLLLGLVVLVSCVTGRQLTTTKFATKTAAFSMPPLALLQKHVPMMRGQGCENMLCKSMAVRSPCGLGRTGVLPLLSASRYCPPPPHASASFDMLF